MGRQRRFPVLPHGERQASDPDQDAIGKCPYVERHHAALHLCFDVSATRLTLGQRGVATGPGTRMEYQRVHRLSLSEILSSKLISILTEKYLRLSLSENFVRLPKRVDAIALRTGMDPPIAQESICECH
jgi:hypothetical protein